jgi:2'-5' RNA ligase
VEEASANMYFAAIVLPAHLDERILYWKKLMQERYGCKVGLKSPAHITFIPPFWMESSEEGNFIKDIDAVAATIPVFTISTNNFSAFKPRTIFVAVDQNVELEQAKLKVDAFFQQHNPYKVKLDRRPFHPHISIATRDLFKKDFYEAWPLFEKELFKENFTAEGLSILRHNKKNWDVIHTSQFKNIVSPVI